MTWFGWTLVFVIALSSLLLIGNIGKPRKPLDNGGAVLAVALNAALIVGILFVGTGTIA